MMKKLILVLIAYLGAAFFPRIMGSVGDEYYHSFFQVLVFLLWFGLLTHFSIAKSIYEYILGLIFSFCMVTGKELWIAGIVGSSK